jgi:hypothetical protein
MDIQSIFYFLASVFMILGIAVMVSVLFFILWLKSSAEEIKQKVSEKVNEAMQARKFAGLIPLIGMAAKWAADRRARQNI